MRMFSIVLWLSVACTPIPDLRCTRNYDPVCADDKVEFPNECLARSAGYHGECARHVKPGGCFSDEGDFSACKPDDEVFSELGYCTLKPWTDFVSCAEEKRQGACAGGRDPNRWVIEHCVLTCAETAAG